MKKIILGTSDPWSLSPSSHRTSDPAYYIEDCRISGHHLRIVSDTLTIFLFCLQERKVLTAPVWCNFIWRSKEKQQQAAAKGLYIYQNCLRFLAHFQWMRGEKVPRESKKCPGTRRGFSSIFVRAHKDSSRCCQAESLRLLLLSPPSLLFLSSVFALKSVHFKNTVAHCVFLDHYYSLDSLWFDRKKKLFYENRQ